MPKVYKEQRKTNKLVCVRLLGDGKWVGWVPMQVMGVMSVLVRPLQVSLCEQPGSSSLSELIFSHNPQGPGL